MLKECPPVVIIDFDTDITLTVLHTPVVIKRKYHPRRNNSETHPPIVGEQGEGSMFCFKMDPRAVASHRSTRRLYNFSLK